MARRKYDWVWVTRGTGGYAGEVDLWQPKTLLKLRRGPWDGRSSEWVSDTGTMLGCLASLCLLQVKAVLGFLPKPGSKQKVRFSYEIVEGEDAQ